MAIGYGFWDTRSEVPMVNGQLCERICSYGCPHLLQIEKHTLSGVHQVWIQCWASVCGELDGKCPVELVLPSFLKSDTIC